MIACCSCSCTSWCKPRRHSYLTLEGLHPRCLLPTLPKYSQLIAHGTITAFTTELSATAARASA